MNRLGLGFTALLALACFSGPALAYTEVREGPLTQADIDAYIFLAPRFFGDIMDYPDQAAKLLNEVKLTRRRAIYITAKIPLTQALARGLISPGQLVGIPVYLHPTTEEVRLVNSNLMTLMQAESAAIDSAGVKVPRKWREAPRK
ncbi:MAG: hypothetical protein LBC90_05650 [Candidatus Adiutrix sp.]|jgi:hypothetical protein|nr:hypothetical protein [Candidatus Adiutrix sp.]